MALPGEDASGWYVLSSRLSSDAIFTLKIALFPRTFGRRQASSALKLKEPDCQSTCVQPVGEAPRSGVKGFDTIYRVRAREVSIPNFWPPAGTRRLRVQKFGRRQAHGAHKLKEPDVLLPRVQHVAEAPRSGAECFDTTYRAPANWLPMLARGAHKLNEPDVRLPHVQRVGKAPLRAECFDTTYGVPASGPLMLLGRRQAHPTPHILTPRAMFRLRSPSRAPLCGAKT
ncbi:hypothetical protein C8R47DRAFT_1219241 [Mycena vitilis]|nr:hypothetical protein C8R47DRAFT_1219241 [Mycena vitilis]